MSKFDEAIATYSEQLNAIMGEHDGALLTQIAKNLGPSIYLGDASRVSCSDKEEKQRIKTNYLVGKLGCEDSAELDGYIETVCNQMGSSNRNKYRAVFYYLLVTQLDLVHKVMN